MLNDQQTLKGGFERAMPVIGAYWALLIAKSRHMPVNEDVNRILTTNSDYVTNRTINRKHRNSKLI